MVRQLHKPPDVPGVVDRTYPSDPGDDESGVCGPGRWGRLWFGGVGTRPLTGVALRGRGSNEKRNYSFSRLRT